jgi:hypothetical protein
MVDSDAEVPPSEGGGGITAIQRGARKMRFLPRTPSQKELAKQRIKAKSQRLCDPEVQNEADSLNDQTRQNKALSTLKAKLLAVGSLAPKPRCSSRERTVRP